MAAEAPEAERFLDDAELLDRIENEMDQMICRHLLPQIGRQQPRGVPVDRNKTGSHAS